MLQHSYGGDLQQWGDGGHQCSSSIVAPMLWSHQPSLSRRYIDLGHTVNSSRRSVA